MIKSRSTGYLPSSTLTFISLTKAISIGGSFDKSLTDLPMVKSIFTAFVLVGLGSAPPTLFSVTGTLFLCSVTAALAKPPAFLIGSIMLNPPYNYLNGKNIRHVSHTYNIFPT